MERLCVLSFVAMATKLGPTSEIVKLEEDVVEEAIRALNNKKEVLKTLKEELISYKARCGRFRARIDNRIVCLFRRLLCASK